LETSVEKYKPFLKMEVLDLKIIASCYSRLRESRHLVSGNLQIRCT
jgi:hypothetical protein